MRPGQNIEEALRTDTFLQRRYGTSKNWSGGQFTCKWVGQNKSALIGTNTVQQRSDGQSGLLTSSVLPEDMMLPGRHWEIAINLAFFGGLLFRDFLEVYRAHAASWIKAISGGEGIFAVSARFFYPGFLEDGAGVEQSQIENGCFCFIVNDELSWASSKVFVCFSNGVY